MARIPVHTVQNAPAAAKFRLGAGEHELDALTGVVREAAADSGRPGEGI